MRFSILAALALAAAPSFASDLVGPESCRTCHAEAYAQWAKSKHARSGDALPAEQRNQALCLQCHARDEARSGAALVSGVSCETCHGGGRFYQPEVVMRDKELARLFGLADLGNAQVTSSLCLSCHGGDVPSAKPFELKAALEKIDHWSADRARRAEKAKAKSARLGRPAGLVASWMRK